ncbi:MAG: hypothetical protein GY854_14605 [Deltaproteobacteria bacterium]|nr:hypothetical protein [Deltaproteobacteria bacterium]
MSRVTVIMIIAFAAVATFCESGHASRRGRRNISPNGEFSFQVESNGRALPTYNHRGRTYVEGRMGKDYQIRVFNHTSRRVETVATVDGRDAISGNVGDYRNQRGYVIEPYDSVLIDGFRTSWQRVAAFRFTDVGDSYAARMGDATNVGVIGVAVFKERTYRPKPRPSIAKERRKKRLGTRYGGGSDRSLGKAKSRSSHSYEMDDLAGGAACEPAPSRRDKRSNLGTQYGEDTYSPSTSTQFMRKNSRKPDALLAVRYDDHQGLIARGVLPRPRPRPVYHRPSPKPNPFPNSPEPGFAPPPPRYYWE